MRRMAGSRRRQSSPSLRASRNTKRDRASCAHSRPDPRGTRLACVYNLRMGTNLEPLWDGLITGVALATLDSDAGYGAVEDAALGWRDGVISFVGARSQLPAA